MGKITDFNNWRRIRLKYKHGRIVINPRNIFDVKTIDDMERTANLQLDVIQKEIDSTKRCHDLNQLMRLTIGNWITKECFMEILDYIILDYNLFEDYIKHYEKDYPDRLNETKWFYHLDEPYIRTRKQDGQHK